MQEAQREQRQQSLADLLADDTGNLRPEVADIVMGEMPQRRVNRPRRRIQLRPIPIPTREIILIGSLILAFFIGRIFNSSIKDTKVGEKKEIQEQIQEHVQNQIQTQNHVQIKNKVKEQINEQVRIQDHYQGRPTMQREAVQTPWQERRNSGLGKGNVFGYNVNIRQAPSLKSPIIAKANQNETFKVLSFSDGWYQVLLGNNSRGYIFGAYLLPMDFNVSQYKVGVGENGRKLLLTQSRNGGWYQEVLPNGQRRDIQKGSVRIVQ